MGRMAQLSAVIVLAACASSSPSSRITEGWVVNVVTDSFTDQQTCRVTWAYGSRGRSYRETFKLYPVAEFTKQGALKLGVESVSLNRHVKVDLPVGTVQMRVDRNQAHQIEPYSVGSYRQALNSTDVVTQSLALQDQISKASAPQTLAEGEVAEAIFSEMLSGQRIIIRQVTAGSNGNTGTFPLSGFAAAAGQCRRL